MEEKQTSFIAAFRRLASVLGFCQTVCFYAARRLKRQSMRLKVHGIAHPVLCRPCDSDIYALVHVFVNKDCDVPLTPLPATIIDGGANVGYASVFYANKYPKAQILAIEPEASNYALAAENCLPYPNVQVIQGGIWVEDSVLSITNPDHSSWAFQLGDIKEGESDAIAGFTIPSLLQNQGWSGIDLLKMDIEGAEEAIFGADNIDWLNRVRSIAVEVHGESALQTIQKALEKYSFDHTWQGEKLILTNKNWRRI